MVGMGCCVTGNRVAINCWSEIPGGMFTDCVLTTSVLAEVMPVATTPFELTIGVATKPLQADTIIEARTKEITLLPMIFKISLPSILA